mmetsp:Transcript_11514/g.33919  ORF Transcript_11514/g.33919 Transcript_11514/m.33919 type:complete len:440 (-) Transcript_11514:149-1468(-)
MKVGPSRIGKKYPNRATRRRKLKSCRAGSPACPPRSEEHPGGKTNIDEECKVGSSGEDGTHENNGTQQQRRNCDGLYVCRETYDCASLNSCVPCAYKICTFDVSLDREFTSTVPNKRPEACPRFPRGTRRVGGRDGTMGYRNGMNVLTVGDGDLSFSLAIARIVMQREGESDPKSARRPKQNRLIATSYESRSTLLKVYPGIGDTIEELESLGADVCYEVDATRLVETLPESLSRRSLSFDRIVWNFPCSAVPSGQDGQNDEMENNKDLVRCFVRNASDMLKEGGEVHMAHKTKPPYNQWQLEKIALEGLGKECEDKTGGKKQPARLEYKGRIVLDRCCIPPYVPRKALDKKSFTCHDACVFVFGGEDSGGGRGRKGDGAFPATIFDEGRGTEHVAPASPIIPITQSMLEKLRDDILASGKQHRTAKFKQQGKWKRSRR